MSKQFERISTELYKINLNNLSDKGGIEIDKIEIDTDDENLKLGNFEIKIGGCVVFSFPCKYLMENMNLLNEFGYKTLPIKYIIYHLVDINIYYEGNINNIILHYHDKSLDYIKDNNVKSISSFYQKENANHIDIKLNWNGKSDKIIINKKISFAQLQIDNKIYDNLSISITENNSSILHFNEIINFSAVNLIKLIINFIQEENDIFIYSTVSNILIVNSGMAGLQFSFGDNLTRPLLYFNNKSYYSNDVSYNYLDYLLTNLSI